MRFLADERVDGPIVHALRLTGRDVTYVAEMAPGTSDEIVLAAANREGRVLLTSDKDFGELVFRQHLLTPGVVLIRLAGLPSSDKVRLVTEVVRDREAEMPAAFTVIMARSVRIRRSHMP